MNSKMEPAGIVLHNGRPQHGARSVDRPAQMLTTHAAGWTFRYGARLSELLGLIWADLDIADLDTASISFTHQVDRKGNRAPLKTEDSEGTVLMPRAVAAMLRLHRARSIYAGSHDFVFATRTGRALSQRNVLRALKATQRRARRRDGRPTFPALHGDDALERGVVPNFHGFRHTAASYALAAGDTAEEVGWMLRHKNSTVTRAIYLQEVKTAERTSRARAKTERRHRSVLNRLTAL